MVQIPSHLKETLEELQYFEDVMNEASMTAEERERYERSLDAYRQEMNVMSFYTRKGKEEGIEIGEARGVEIGKKLQSIETARTLKKLGISIEAISQATKLTIDEINALD